MRELSTAEVLQKKQFVYAPPQAATLVEALRGFGYAPGTAIADIIDNSITAGARCVRVDFHWLGHDSYITILDDGHGMNGPQLESAMVLGAQGPLAERSPSDLGRFGLGLKTASFSQCRSLTVASKRSGSPTVVARWDLDHITRREINDWQLLLSAREGSDIRLRPLDEVTHGTIVLWEGLDRILERLPGAPAKVSAFLEIADAVERHLAMVFHRYLEGPNPLLRIYMNGDEEARRVRPWDPFLTHHPATFATPEEVISTSSGLITLQGFVLPHKDRLDSIQYREAGGPDGWTAQQGFYVYRNDRLLVAGSWLGLGEGRAWTKEEAYQLARLRLDLPNTADHEWDLDVRKSIARPPGYLKPRLRDLALRIRTDARRVFAHRGSYRARSQNSNFRPLWLARERSDGVKYLIDRSHAAVQRAIELATDPTALDDLLLLIEATVPVQRIWLDVAERGQIQGTPLDPETKQKLASVLRELAVHLIKKRGLTPDDARTQLKLTEPFSDNPELVDDVVEQVLGERSS